MKPSYKHFFVPFGEVTSTTPLHDNPILPSLTRSSPIGETPNLVDGYKSGPETMLGQIRIGYRQPYNNNPAALPPRKPSYPSATCSSAIHPTTPSVHFRPSVLHQPGSAEASLPLLFYFTPFPRAHFDSDRRLLLRPFGLRFRLSSDSVLAPLRFHLHLSISLLYC